nr:MAG TPA: LAMBDA REPRESSOR (TRIPLE MUTANT)/DNA COMPLEX-DNA COMPLEX, DOUBLE HELIX, TRANSCRIPTION-DNA.1A [Bacteriophage sp.]
MFRNLDAEQARKGFNNSDVAERLGISRVSYENKKKTGKFTTFEIKALCKLFDSKFDYLFSTTE